MPPLKSAAVVPTFPMPRTGLMLYITIDPGLSWIFWYYRASRNYTWESFKEIKKFHFNFHAIKFYSMRDILVWLVKVTILALKMDIIGLLGYAKLYHEVAKPNCQIYKFPSIFVHLKKLTQYPRYKSILPLLIDQWSC